MQSILNPFANKGMSIREDESDTQSQGLTKSYSYNIRNTYTAKHAGKGPGIQKYSSFNFNVDYMPSSTKNGAKNTPIEEDDSIEIAQD